MDYALQGEFVEDGKQVVVVDLQRHVARPDSPTVPAPVGVAGGKEPPRAPRA